MVIYNKGLSVYASILERNSGLALIFLTLWLYSCDFKAKTQFAPTL
jgi:succinate dehydrogenase/fumarate reductase cytochrome b subunit